MLAELDAAEGVPATATDAVAVAFWPMKTDGDAVGDMPSDFDAPPATAAEGVADTVVDPVAVS